MGFGFCELPDDFELIEARLFLFYNPQASHVGHTTSGSNSASLFKINGEWTEKTTWSTRPSFSQSPSASLSPAIFEDQDYIIDVTKLVSACLRVRDPLDFYLKLDEEESYRSLTFASSDHVNNRLHPRLEITFRGTAPECLDIDPPNDLPDLDSCLTQMSIPSVFTPNNDGSNDEIELEDPCEEVELSLEVYDRWGRLIYKAQGDRISWNGRGQKGDKMVPEGIYFYILELKKGENKKIKKGNITILR